MDRAEQYNRANLRKLPTPTLHKLIMPRIYEGKVIIPKERFQNLINEELTQRARNHQQ